MDKCMDSSLKAILSIVKSFLLLVQIVVPILLILFGTISFLKMIKNSKEKNGIKKIYNKFLAAVIVFFIPVIINAVMSLIGENSNFSSCWNETNDRIFFSKKYYSNDRNKKIVLPNSTDYEQGKNRSGLAIAELAVRVTPIADPDKTVVLAPWNFHNDEISAKCGSYYTPNPWYPPSNVDVSTVIKHYTILKLLFKMAYMDDSISRNPMDKVERPTPRKDELIKTEIKSYTADEVMYILDCLENESLKWQLYLRLLIDTGIRRGECCGLQWKNVDYKNCTITIENTLYYTPQKGVYLDTPKNGKKRTIDVDPEIMELLRKHQLSQASQMISNFVFTQDDSIEPMNPQSPTKFMKRFADKYNIEHLHPHKLRHSFASIAITNGADVASVSEKLGHSDKAVTLRMYTHADAESMKRASQIFRDALKRKEA